MCHLLFCEQKQNALYSLIRSTHPALEGTSCGSGKVNSHFVFNAQNSKKSKINGLTDAYVVFILGM